LNLYSIDKNENYAPCPITAQDLAILLRQDISAVLYPGCLAGQDLNYFIGDNYGLNSCIYGSNSYPRAVGLQLPTSFIENIKALQQFFLVLNDVGKTGKMTSKSPVAIYVPVLSIPITPPWAPSVQWQYTGVPGLQNIFTIAPSEVVINLVDGTAATGVAIDFNSIAAATKASLFNDWFRPLKTYCYSTGVLNKDSCANVLRSLIYTRYLASTTGQTDVLDVPMYGEYDPENKMEKKKSRKEFTLRDALKKGSVVSNGIYDSFGVSMYTTPGNFYAAAWKPCLSYWILPVASIDKYPEQAVAQAEVGNLQTAGPTTTGAKPEQSLSSVHREYAAMMTRGTFGDKSEMEVMVTKSSEEGEGGFFADLLGPLADKVIPGLGSVVQALPL